MEDPGFGESRDSRRAVVMTRQHLLDRRDTRVSALLIAQVAQFGLPGTTSAREYEAGRIGFWGAHDNGRGEAHRAHVAIDAELRRERHRVRALAWSGYRRLELLENFTGFIERPVQGDRRVQRHQALPFGLRVDHAVQLGRRVELDSGIGVRGDLFEQSEDRVDLQARPFERTRAATGLQADIWLFSGVRWTIGPTLELGAGARVDLFAIDILDDVPLELEDSPDGSAVHGGGVRFAASPRVHLRWAALPSLDLFAAYGRGFRPPEARAFTSFDPERVGPFDDRVTNEGPRSTASDNGEIGLRWVPREWLNLHIAGFATYLASESIFDHVSRTNLQLSATRRLGVELGVDSHPKPWLGLAGSVTWVDAAFIASRNPVPLAPPLVASVRSWLTHPIGARAGLMLVGWAPRPLPYGARGSGLARLDATTGWHLERIHVDLAIENVLGLELREGEYYFASNFRPGEPASQLPTLHFVPGPPLNARLSVTVIW